MYTCPEIIKAPDTWTAPATITPLPLAIHTPDVKINPDHVAATIPAELNPPEKKAIGPPEKMSAITYVPDINLNPDQGPAVIPAELKAPDTKSMSCPEMDVTTVPDTIAPICPPDTHTAFPDTDVMTVPDTKAPI
jgi:hypothetical protein